MTNAEKIAEFLVNKGIKYVFGIPGGPSIPYMEAFREHGIAFILVANEASAGFMADVTARLTGIPGVCHATFGPGATNLSTGVGGALLDRSPVIAFTTEPTDSMRYRVTQMNINHQELFTPLTKWTTRLEAHHINETLEIAFEKATSGLPGPVHMGLPSDLAEKPYTIQGEYQPDNNKKGENGAVTVPDEIIRQVERSRKPLLAVGLTAVRQNLKKGVLQFLEKNPMPVVLTPMAKGILPEDHPCYLGVLFHAGGETIAPVYRQSDLVIGLGYDPVEFNYESWIPDVPVVHIDTSPLQGDFLKMEWIERDLNKMFNQFSDHVLIQSDWSTHLIQEHKNSLFQLFLTEKSFDPVKVLKVLREKMEPTGILTCDVGSHTHLIGQYWQTPEPHTLLMTNGWSSMGFGVPAALAAKLCAPDKQVVCVTGDGGFLMMAGEILTARRLNLHIIFIVLADKELNLIHVKQKWKQKAPYATILYEGNYFGAGRFFDVPVYSCRSENEFIKALDKAFASEGPQIIEAYVDGEVYHSLITKAYK